MRLICPRCYYARGIHRPSADAISQLCEDCRDDYAQSVVEAALSAYHGGSAWGDSAQLERERREGVRR